MGTLNNNVISQLSELEMKNRDIILSFFNDNISLKKEDYASKEEYTAVIHYLITLLSGTTPADLIETIKKNYKHKEITSRDIPQFSDLSVALYDTPQKLHEQNARDLTYEQVGQLLWDSPRDIGADKKYGENHAKTAAQIGLTSVENGKINITDFGRIFLSHNPAIQASLLPALWLKSPLFHNYYGSANGESTLSLDISVLSESTRKRRLSNIRTIINLIDNGYFFREQSPVNNKKSHVQTDSTSDSLAKYMRAMRAKPFLLLAGISGTGKSRIVKQMAFDSCPDIPQLRKDPISPGNYCLIEVKPNWHDSTELLGYESQISRNYILTPFIRFVAKAMLFPEVPFFVCLDEMNLAPVEQYFAEFLSVLESRKKHDGIITSEPLISPSIFSSYDLSNDLFADNLNKEDGVKFYGREHAIYLKLCEEGLRIPENLIVIGTVNMDETTHQFSRKVIDRAMTIEMNIEEGESPFKEFFTHAKSLEYPTTPLSSALFLPEYVSAEEALQSMDDYTVSLLKDVIPTKLAELNATLNGTPFKIAYRVQNELILYFASLLSEHSEEVSETLLNQAIDDILMMKVLPRIEGDEECLQTPLEKLADFCVPYRESAKKVKEMQERLERAHFTSFWP